MGKIISKGSSLTKKQIKDLSLRYLRNLEKKLFDCFIEINKTSRKYQGDPLEKEERIRNLKENEYAILKKDMIRYKIWKKDYDKIILNSEKILNFNEFIDYLNKYFRKE